MSECTEETDKAISELYAPEGFERLVLVNPAYDKRSSELGKNYGIGSCVIYFILKGQLGAVQFAIGTNWHVPSARKHLKGKPPYMQDHKPMGWDVGYHSPVPTYDNEDPMDCYILEEGKCYYDGSSLRAEDWIDDFIAGGTGWLWPKLMEDYNRIFGETK